MQWVIVTAIGQLVALAPETAARQTGCGRRCRRVVADPGRYNNLRGLLARSFTRIYIDDEAEANAADAVLVSVPAARRATLIARREMTGAGPVYRFDIHMQGEKETVFFDL